MSSESLWQDWEEKQLLFVTALENCSKLEVEQWSVELHAALSAVWQSGTIPHYCKRGQLFPIWENKTGQSELQRLQRYYTNKCARQDGRVVSERCSEFRANSSSPIEGLAIDQAFIEWPMIPCVLLSTHWTPCSACDNDGVLASEGMQCLLPGDWLIQAAVWTMV